MVGEDALTVVVVVVCDSCCDVCCMDDLRAAGECGELDGFGDQLF